MADMFSNLSLGLAVVLSLKTLGLCFLGCLIGTLIGVLPGIGPVATIAMLLPVTFGLDPTGALIMLAGIYYGAQYGGSTTAIIVNIPGEVTSVITVLDGHQMAQQGRAGVALGTAAIGSFVAGTIATVIIAALGAPLAQFALRFGPADYFSLMVFGLMFAVVLARGSLLKAVAMIFVGILLSTVGTDLETGQARLTFGRPEIYDGIEFAVIAMGVFGFAEILRTVEQREIRNVEKTPIGRLLPDGKDLREAAWPILRGTFIGAFLGLLPGNGAVLGPFASYAAEKRLSKDPSRFGKGAIEGVAGPESANNAGAQTSFLPLLTLGIPPNAVMALMVGAMTIHGIQPGPQIISKQPGLFWGMVASMWIGNLMLLVINLPLVGLWIRLIRAPYRLLFPAIILFCCIGIYSINNSSAEVTMVAIFGFVGYLLMKLEFEPAPLILGFVLGKLLEEKFRQSLLISRGSLATFTEHSISATLLALTAILFVISLLPAINKARNKVFVE
ncbi:MAG TPA: tripartite tricarboxylate transporter permease [Hyphomicrobiales bacterium]|jgi:putative tricarboxylic transport membrane protein